MLNQPAAEPAHRFDAKTMAALVLLLNQSLADSLDLAYQTKQAHWNVKGFNFLGLNLLFEDFHGQLVGYVEEFANRVVCIGGQAMGTIRVAGSTTQLDEYPLDAMDSKVHVNTLLDRYGDYTSRMRSSCHKSTRLGDPITAQLYGTVSRGMDKTLWKLTGHQEA